VKLACFGQRSWGELKACVQEWMPRPRRRGRRPKANPVSGRADVAAGRTPSDAGSDLVGGGRSPAKPSGWALAAEMERYLAAHTAPPNGKTVRAVRT